MHSSSHGSTGYLGKLLYFNNFGKSVVLFLRYQMSFLQSGGFSGKTVAHLDIANLSSALEV